MCVLISPHVHKTDHEIVKGKARAFRVPKDYFAWSASGPEENSDCVYLVLPSEEDERHGTAMDSVRGGVFSHWSLSPTHHGRVFRPEL